MASPQLEHGHTPFANELLEAILRKLTNGRELKVVFAVGRLTYGWSRKATTVTAYRVAQITAIDRTHASRTIKDLIERRVLVKADDGTVGIQKNYDLWLDRTECNPHRVQSAPGAGRTATPGAIRTGGTRCESAHVVKQGSKARKQAPSASAPGSTWLTFLESLSGAVNSEDPAAPPVQSAPGAIRTGCNAHPPGGAADILRRTAEAIGTTRKSGRISPSILDALATKLAEYPVEAVITGCEIYVTKGHAAQGRRENYLIGIVRGEADRLQRAAGGPAEPSEASLELKPGELIGMWNEGRPPECPAVEDVSDPGRLELERHARIRKPERAYWEKNLTEFHRSSRLRGQNNDGWIATCDWWLGSKNGTPNYVRVGEGQYRDANRKPPSPFKPRMFDE